MGGRVAGKVGYAMNNYNGEYIMFSLPTPFQMYCFFLLLAFVTKSK